MDGQASTDLREDAKGQRAIIWDDECAFCTATARLIRPLFEKRGFAFVPLREWLAGMDTHERARHASDEMRAISASGRIYGGADAVLYLMRQLWWAWPLGQIGRVPPIVQALRAIYRWIARNRQCLSGQCRR